MLSHGLLVCGRTFAYVDIIEHERIPCESPFVDSTDMYSE
jgi:hypothetical protein